MRTDDVENGIEEGRVGEEGRKRKREEQGVEGEWGKGWGLEGGSKEVGGCQDGGSECQQEYSAQCRKLGAAK